MGILCCRNVNLEKYENAQSPEPNPKLENRQHRRGDKRRSEKRSSGPSITFAAYTQGGRPEQQPSQDEMLAIHKLGGDPWMHLFAVFDGHGEFGGEVSMFLKRNFPAVLLNERDFPTKPVLALKDTCVKVNNMLKTTGLDICLSGSTGCVCLIIRNTLYTCNVGDSRAIAGVGLSELPRAVQLTTDHTASNPKEKQRILQARGRVIKKRIYTADSNLPGLIPSRSFGDSMGCRAGVVCQPDVCVYSISAEYRFLAVMSDGVWENVQPAHIAKHVVLSDTLTSAAREIVKDAERTVHVGNKYRDDMTAVLVEFHGFGEDVKAEALAEEAEMMKDPNDRVAFAISICQELIAQGVHPEDAPDAIMGLTVQQRQQVIEAVGSGHQTEQPGAVQGVGSMGLTTSSPNSASDTDSSTGSDGVGRSRKPWYKSWLGGNGDE